MFAVTPASRDRNRPRPSTPGGVSTRVRDPVNADRPELHSQMQQLQAELSTRESTRHFAHAAVSVMIASIFAGAAAKLFWDSVRTPVLGFGAAALALGLVIYSTIHYRKARRLQRHELARFETLQQLRRSLHLDDPASLLPR